MNKIIKRKIYTDQIEGFINQNIIKILTGIRRSGKSEILKLIKENILKTIDEEHIIFINFENLDYDNLKTYKDLNNYILDKIKDEQKYYLFFDEIQNVKDWEKAINSLRLRNTDIYITGSNSKLLSGELATLLSGRYVQFEIKPLSYLEFIDFRLTNSIYGNFNNFNDYDNFKKEGALFTKDGLDWTARVYNELLKDYIEIGGFPLLSTATFTKNQAMQIIKDIHSSIVLKDVISRNSIKNIQLLEKVIAYFYDNIGNLTSLRKIADYISGGDTLKKSVNLETISNYVSYLEAAYIVKKVQRYDIKGKKIFETNDKYYPTDHSLPYALKDINKVNKGGILENIVFNELITRKYNVYIGKLNTKEIDFVAEKNGEKIYIQVCLEFTSEETYKREILPLKEIRDNYPKYVVTLSSPSIMNDEGIIIIPLKEFLCDNSY